MKPVTEENVLLYSAWMSVKRIDLFEGKILLKRRCMYQNKI